MRLDTDRKIRHPLLLPKREGTSAVVREGTVGAVELVEAWEHFELVEGDCVEVRQSYQSLW